MSVSEESILVFGKEPTLVVGNMWDEYDNIMARDGRFLITANSYLTKDDYKLAMGRGIAEQAAKRFPTLPRQAGIAVRDRCGHLGEYGVILQPHNIMPVGLFQTKFHYRDISDIDLIMASTGILSVYATSTRAREFHVNFPGIGYGGLSRDKVLPILMDTLPSNVYIWELPYESAS